VSIRSLISLSVAVFLGLLALLLVRAYLVSHTAGPVMAKQATSPVVVAAAPIARGAALKPEMFKLASYPRESVPQGAFTTVQQVMKSPDGNPRSAVREMVANEPVVASKLSGSGVNANLSGVLAPGMRAVSVKSSEVTGVGGFALPGDRVDVLVTRQVGSGQTASSVLQVLAENVRVLGVDQSSDADKPVVSKAVTIEVTPQQAQAIALAQAVGQVTLALRQTSDTSPLAKRAMTVADLGPLGAQRPPRRVLVAHRPEPTVRVTRGVKVENYVTFN
jgi:pilus assembly protein CpaB